MDQLLESAKKSLSRLVLVGSVFVVKQLVLTLLLFLFSLDRCVSFSCSTIFLHWQQASPVLTPDSFN